MKNLLINRALAAKKKKIFTFFLALVASVGTIFAKAVQIGDLYYNLNQTNKTAEVTYKSYNDNTYNYNEDWNVTTANIPSSVTYKSVTYSVTSIGDHAFDDSGLTSVTIPNSVTSIGERAFFRCSRLNSITIPNSVTNIGGGAFNSCAYLSSVTIPNSVTSIGESVFCNCRSLTSVTIPNSVTSIGKSAFLGCSGLTSVTIPNSVTSIGERAFDSCTGLTSITIPNSVTSIEYCAFRGCSGLTSITIPNSVTSIGENAFLVCSGLTSINVETNNPNYCSVEGVLFNKDKTRLIQYPGGKQGAYTIPNSVTSIGDRAFLYCTGLTSVTIEAETPPVLSNYVFDDTNNCPIYVPCNAVNTYKAAWSNYANRIRGNGNCASSYTVRFLNWDGSVLQSTQVEEGKMPQYTGATPTRPDDSQYTYTFSGWTPQIVAATADATYTATFAATKTPPQPTYYTIKFKNWDGSVLQSTQVEEGKMPQYTGTTPTKPSDSQYSYTFSGWTPQIVAATADATYTATFTAEPITSDDCTDVNATWLQTGGSGLGEMTTDNSGVWKYEYQYGACAKANSGETGWLLTPAKDLRGMKSVNLSFLHVHKNAGTFTDEMTLWVCANYKGSVSASQWQQLTISPYSANNDWVFVNVSIDVPLNMVGANTVFGFKYTSSNYSAKWEIKKLNLNAECAKADETTTTDVTATPNEDNSVTLTWPAVNGADTYTIEIKKNGVSVCTLVFNANGQLISINIAAPARDGKGRNVPAAEQSASGWTYVVTGLEGNASYTYSVTAKDVNGNVLLKQSVDFSTGDDQGIEDVLSDQVQCTKVIKNGQILILRGDKTYTLTGQETIMP